ncbi:MAG TPA: hypothetical protein VLM89_13675 [Phycisphaerae bacterium]|nr:hypothetical protein [Phycisphaerae bacterium]
MAKFSLRRYEDQARASVVVGIAACLGLLAQAVLVFRHINLSEWTIMYGSPNRRTLVLAATAAVLGLGLAALGLGFNSAGQKRNDKPQFSWIGFFLGAGTICLTIIFMCLFHFRAEFIGVPK